MLGKTFPSYAASAEWLAARRASPVRLRAVSSHRRSSAFSACPCRLRSNDEHAHLLSDPRQ